MQKKVSLSGFRDFLPEEARVRNYIKEKIQEVFELYGFEPLETPAIERAEVLLGKYGEEADKLLYLFEDRGGRKVGLRYDLTVPTARVLASYAGSKIKLPFKRYQIQDVFRAERPQKGRYRQFLQCDIDIFGSRSPLSDAETLVVIARALETIGLNDFTIRINSRNLLFKALENFGIEDSKTRLLALRIIDKLDKKERRKVEDELERKGFSRGLISEFEKLKADDEIQKIIELANKLGIKREKISFYPFLVRGLDYYTGMIFEIVVPEFKGSIAGGGRYDNLVKTLGGPDIPAVGGSLGFERIYDFLKEKILGKIRSTEKKVFVSVFSEEFLGESIKILKFLREKGIKADIYLKEKFDLKKQLKYADLKGFSYVVFWGPEEREKGKVKIKNMISGKEELVELDKVAKILE